MRVGCPQGSFGPVEGGLLCAIDLSCPALTAAFSKFETGKGKPKYLHCWSTPEAKKVLYGWSIAQGLRELPVTLVRDPGCKTHLHGSGWIVSDEFPDGGVVVDWDYVFPVSVKLVNGVVEKG